MFEYVPDRPLNPPEDSRSSVYSCYECGEPIKDGDDYWLLGEQYFCESCVNEARGTAESGGGYYD